MKHLTLAIALLAAPAWAAEEGGVPEWVKNTKVFSEAFVDAYYMAANHDPAIENANGFWVRRIYLGVESKLSQDFTARLRFEMNSSGDFKTSAVMTPYVKDAWVRWHDGPRDLTVGLSGTPTWTKVEKIWGYRSIEKTPVELQRLGNSSDMGVGLVGSASDGKISYSVMAGNGAGTATEINQGKKVYGSLGYHPNKKWVAEGYADYEARPDHGDRTTVQGFVAYQDEKARAGVVFARQIRQVTTGPDLKLDILGVFAVVKVHERINLVGRFDRMFDPNPDGAKIAFLPFAPTAKSNLFIVGVDFKLLKSLSLIPNLEYVHYDGSGAPDDDLMTRLTAAWSF